MGKYLKQFDTHQQYEAYTADTENFILPNVSYCIDTPNEVHYNPYVEPIDPCASEIVQTSYEWVEIGGIKWATKNVGALTVTDYGQKFSWGGTNGYTNDQVSGDCHSKAFSWTDYEFGNGTSSPGDTGMSKYNATDGKTVLDAEDDAATVNMGSGWRMPTTAEFQALGTATTSAWTSSYEGSGVAGLVLTSKADSNVKLFFPAAGYCYDGSVGNVGSYGSYWSRSLFTSVRRNAYLMVFLSSSVYWDSCYNRCRGCSVRGVLDE